MHVLHREHILHLRLPCHLFLDEIFDSSVPRRIQRLVSSFHEGSISLYGDDSLFNSCRARGTTSNLMMWIPTISTSTLSRSIIAGVRLIQRLRWSKRPSSSLNTSKEILGWS